jgi:hypothetical protein
MNGSFESNEGNENFSLHKQDVSEILYSQVHVLSHSVTE